MVKKTPIPCETCVLLAVCKSESYNYDSDRSRINPITYAKCEDFLIKYTRKRGISIQLLLENIRVYLRPDLPYFNIKCLD